MFAAYAARSSPDDPLSALELGERPDPRDLAPGWTTVRLKAAALNHHDLWSLRGVGLAEDKLPMVLARMSSAPRKTPGKASTLLIWLG